MSNISNFPGGKRDNGEPPHNDGMEARVTNLEDFAIDTRDRLARIETRLDVFATKEDLHREIGGIHAEMNKQTWRIITWMTGVCAALVTVVYFIANHAK
jgi:hypothetical protein